LVEFLDCLYIVWNKTKAAYISSTNTMSTAFLALHLEWETIDNASKLLGFPMAQEISKAQMTSMLLAKLDKAL
jgi:hypothetical protein